MSKNPSRIPVSVRRHSSEADVPNNKVSPSLIQNQMYQSGIQKSDSFINNNKAGAL